MEPGITSIGIVTRNRPLVLTRALTSYIKNCNSYGRTPDFVVMDDSDDTALRDECREVLLQLKTRYDANILYCCSQDKRRVSAALADLGVPEDVVTFALFGLGEPGLSFGSNRNALLLQTIGEQVFSSDDDVSCEIVEAPGRKPGVEVFPAQWGLEPLAFWFFPDRQTAIRSSNFIKTDILGIHEQLLGKEVARLLSQGDSPPCFNLDDADVFAQGISSGEAKVLITMNGIIGDSGMSSQRWFVLTGDSRARLLQSESAYHSAYTSREILRVVNRPTISLGPMLMSTAFGFDNRQLLPPFFPVDRNEDGIFGLCLRKCLENGYIAHLPWALLHAPPERRLSSKDNIWKHSSSFRISDMLMICVDAAKLNDSKASIEDRITTLGSRLVEQGSMTQPDFEEFLRLQIARHLSSHISALEERLQTYKECPTFWADDIRKYLEVLRTSSRQSGFETPTSLERQGSSQEARESAKGLVYSFGRLLCHWPSVVKAAKELKAQDQSLARRIS